MGRRGPPPTPTPILEARGSWRAKARDGEPRLPLSAPACPGWLSAEAKEEWRRQIAQLKQMGCIARCDRAALSIYCEAWAEFERATRQLEGGMLIAAGKDDSEIAPHPLMAIRDRAADRVLKLAREFGFTPSSRTQLRGETRHSAMTPEVPANGEPRLYTIHA